MKKYGKKRTQLNRFKGTVIDHQSKTNELSHLLLHIKQLSLRSIIVFNRYDTLENIWKQKERTETKRLRQHLVTSP